MGIFGELSYVWGAEIIIHKLYRVDMMNTCVNPKPPMGYPLCLSATCGLRTECLHALIAEAALQREPVTVQINPHHPEYKEGEACQSFRSATPETYARGFRKIMNDLTKRNYTACTRHLIGQHSSSQFYKMRSGKIPLAPQEQQELLELFRAYGYRGDSTFDSYEKRLTW